VIETTDSLYIATGSAVASSGMSMQSADELNGIGIAATAGPKPIPKNEQK
jgi:hypothetical protein